MKLRDAASILPAVFLFAIVGCGYAASQSEETPTPTFTAQPTQTHTETPEPTATPAPKPASPKPSKNEVQICGEIFEKTPVTVTMQSEIAQIRKDYSYICDIDWDLFESTDTWGKAWTPGAEIEINEDIDRYRVLDSDTQEDMEFQVRETVRHEFGHQVIFQHFGYPGEDDIDIRKIFGNYQPDPTTGDIDDSYTADELAADVMAAVLNPDHHSPYVTRYDEEVLNSARSYLDDTKQVL